MRIFVDTSAFFALFDRDDVNLKKAKPVPICHNSSDVPETIS